MYVILIIFLIILLILIQGKEFLTIEVPYGTYIREFNTEKKFFYQAPYQSSDFQDLQLIE